MGMAQTEVFINFQMSPDGKWLWIFSSRTMGRENPEPGKWMAMYIVQEGDVFTDRDGTVLEWVKPGELEALTEGFTTSESMTPVEKYDFVSMYNADRQMYLSAPEPPYGDIIENIGVTPITAKSKSKASKSVGKGKSGKAKKRKTGNRGKLRGNFK